MTPSVSFNPNISSNAWALALAEHERSAGKVGEGEREETLAKGAGAFGAGFPTTEVTPVTGLPKVGGVEGVQGVQFGGEFAEIAARGMRVNDTEMGVNQPFPTTPQEQLGRKGVVGADFRLLA